MFMDDLVAAILILGLIALALLILIYPLLGALKLKDSTDKTLWVLIIIFLYPLGSLVYWLAKPYKKESKT